MNSAEEDLREFFRSAPLDVPEPAPVASIVSGARRRRRYRSTAWGVAVTGLASIAAVGVVAVAGLTDVVIDPAGGAEQRPGISDVDHLDVITPTDVGGLAIGMTLDEVRAAEGVEVTMLGPDQACAARVAVGDTVRGFLEPWPERNGEIVVTTLMYFGTDARTVNGAAVGRRLGGSRLADVETLDTPLGPGTAVVGYGVVGTSYGPTGVGYQTLHSCHSAVTTGADTP